MSLKQVFLPLGVIATLSVAQPQPASAQSSAGATMMMNGGATMMTSQQAIDANTRRSHATA